MNKTAFKLAIISVCLVFTIAACNSNKNTEGTSDSDSTMMGTEGIGTDTMMDTTGTDSINDAIGGGTSGTPGSSGTVPSPNP